MTGGTQAFTTWLPLGTPGSTNPLKLAVVWRLRHVA